MRDKILNISFVVSVIVNFVFLVLVGNSDIFQTQATKDEIRSHVLHVIKPPLPKKPPPKPPKVKPPPPPPHPVKEIVPPKPVVVHLQQPKVIIRAPAVKASPTGNETLATVATTTAPPEETTPAPQVAPTPPPPTPVPTPPPPPPVVKPPPPPPPVIVKPKPPAIPDRADPIPVRDISDDITSNIQVDTSALSSTTIVVRFDVGRDGKVTNCRVTTSSGNNDLDQAAVDACEASTWKPAIQDGEPIESRFSHTFQVS